MKPLLLPILILIFCFNAFAQDAEEKVDWDKIEYRLFKELKEQGGKSDAEIHQAIGYALLKTDNQWQRATLHFKKALALDPTLYFSWYNLGLINMDNPDFFFRKAIETNPKFSPSYYWLAMYYKQCGKEVESIEYFDRYLKVVDRNDPQEKGRIKVAEDAVKGVKNGIR